MGAVTWMGLAQSVKLVVLRVTLLGKHPSWKRVLSDQFNRMTWPSDINQLLSLASSLLTQRAHERNSRGGREGGSEQV